MRAALRSVLAIVLGALAAMLVIMACESLNALIYPPPPGTEPSDREAMNAYVSSLPPTGFILLLVGYAFGTFAGASLAARIGRHAPLTHGLIVGVLFLIATAKNYRQIPHPRWVWIVGLGVILPAAYAGVRYANSVRSLSQSAM